LPSGPHAAHSLVCTAATKQVFCSSLVDACFNSEGAGRMKEFKVYVADKPGELARVTEALSGAAVNIRAIASEAKHDNSFLRVVTSDVQTTEKALSTAGLKYELNDILDWELLDRPGERAKVARRLARAGIDVHSIYILASKNGRTEIALGVDNTERAKATLKWTRPLSPTPARVIYPPGPLATMRPWTN